MVKHLVRIDYGEEHWEDFAQMNRWIYLCYAGDHTETDLYNIFKAGDGWMRNCNVKIDNDIRLSKLCAVRICNKILAEANIDMVLSELHFSEE